MRVNTKIKPNSVLSEHRVPDTRNRNDENVYEDIEDYTKYFKPEHSVPERLVSIAEFFAKNDVVSTKTSMKAGIYIHDTRGTIKQNILYKDIETSAVNRARQLLSAGVKRGDVVALLATTSVEFIVTFMACQFLGAVPSLLPTTIHLGGRDFFVKKIASMLKLINPRLIMFQKNYGEFFNDAKNIAQLKDSSLLSYEELTQYPLKTGRLIPFENDEYCNIQFSSGSTSTPKGILIKQRSLMANIFHGARRLDFHLNNSISVSWLPFYHDMGFIGVFLLALMQGISLFCFEPTTFARNPLLWLQLISRYRGTFTMAPNFSYDLVTRRFKAKAACDYQAAQQRIGSLTSLKVAGVGSEMVNYKVMKNFVDTFEPLGLDAKAISPGYGMAEATLLITAFDYQNRGLEVDFINRKKFQNENIALSVAKEHPEVCEFVSCGFVIENHLLRITDDNEKILKDRQIGNVEFYGKSVMSGYYADEENTAKSITKDGYLKTGDLGYTVDGYLFVTGRKKEIIIYNGKNIAPYSLEYEVIKIGNFRINDVAAFSILDETGTEKLIILAQMRDEDDKISLLQKQIEAVVYKICGAPCKIAFIKPGQMPLTSSGKLSRMPARKMYLNNDFIPFKKNQIKAP